MNITNKFIADAIQLSLSNSLPERIYKINGMSSDKVRNILNNICKIDFFNYLEIGTLEGSTCISSLFNNNFNKAYLIDNWSEFGCNKAKFYENINLFLDNRIKDIEIIEEDCFKIDLIKIKDKINIYFYDGDHSYLAQKKALTYFYGVLAEKFIYIVDDMNEIESFIGTFDAIRKLELKIEFMSILPSRGNCDKDYYWNGIGLFLLKK